MALQPEATFDSLFVMRHLQTRNGGFSIAEVHLFGYLACLLWMYRKEPVADWGYSFVGTELGALFSPQIEDSIKELQDSGYILRDGEKFCLAPIAEETLDSLTGMLTFHDRAECLLASCASTAAFSVGMVQCALSQEPELKRAQEIPLKRQLLEDIAQTQLYAQFEALREGLKTDSKDLRLPAVVWLTALYSSGES
jgi:hypothetical protein